MKLLSIEQNWYVYLEVGLNENYKECVKRLIHRMKELGYKYDIEKFGDFRPEPQDDYGDGRAGSPMFFVKKIKNQSAVWNDPVPSSIIPSNY